MTNELILRYTCAALIVLALTLLFLWRVAREDAQRFKTLSIDLNQQIAKLFHEYIKVCNACDKMISFGKESLKDRKSSD